MSLGIIGTQDGLILAIIEDDAAIFRAVEFVKLRYALYEKTDINLLAAEGRQCSGHVVELAKSCKLIHEQQKLWMCSGFRGIAFGTAFEITEKLRVHKVDRSAPLFYLVRRDSQKNLIFLQILPSEAGGRFAFAAKRVRNLRINREQHQLVAKAAIDGSHGFGFHFEISPSRA